MKNRWLIPADSKATEGPLTSKGLVELLAAHGPGHSVQLVEELAAHHRDLVDDQHCGGGDGGGGEARWAVSQH